MDLKLTRKIAKFDGVFGILQDINGYIVASTLEHAYHIAGESWEPKLPTGMYTCKRGMHRLESMTEDFVTFEVENVPGHTGILFHVGNYNKDSSGCILVGSDIISSMLVCSKDAFKKFLELQENCDSFILTVV